LRLREERWFSLRKTTKYVRTDWAHVVGFLNDKEETEALATLKRLDVGKLNEVRTAFTRFTKSAERNSASYFNMVRMLQKLIDNLGFRISACEETCRNPD
jgi:hypothetical protein